MSRLDYPIKDFWLPAMIIIILILGSLYISSSFKILKKDCERYGTQPQKALFGVYKYCLPKNTTSGRIKEHESVEDEF